MSTPTPPPTTTALADLVAAARAHDPEAWRELVRRYTDMVTAVVARSRLQEADAADAVQSTWLHAVERLPALREPDRLGGWLRVIAEREGRAVARRRRRELPDDGVGVEGSDPSPGPEAVLLAGEVRREVSDALAGLGERPRRLVHELFWNPDSSYAQVSRTTGIPVGGIGPTRSRALSRMRARMAGAGVGDLTPA